MKVKLFDGKAGNIRLALYSSIAINWLIPRLEDFRVQYPEIELTLNMVVGELDHNDTSSDYFITVTLPKAISFNNFYLNNNFISYVEKSYGKK